MGFSSADKESVVSVGNLKALEDKVAMWKRMRDTTVPSPPLCGPADTGGRVGGDAEAGALCRIGHAPGPATCLMDADGGGECAGFEGPPASCPTECTFTPEVAADPDWG